MPEKLTYSYVPFASGAGIATRTSARSKKHVLAYFRSPLWRSITGVRRSRERLGSRGRALRW